MLWIGWLDEVVVGFLVALAVVVVVVVVESGCLGVGGLVGTLGGSGVPVLFSVTDPAKVNISVT